MGRQKEVRELLRDVSRQGGRIEERRKHFVVFAADGRGLAVISKTPSSSNWRNRAAADLRRLGFRI